MKKNIYIIISASIVISVAVLWQNNLFTNKMNSINKIIEEIQKKFPDTKYMSARDLASRLENKDEKSPLLLDTRTKAEFQVSHLPGAVNVESSDGLKEALQGVNKTDLIVTYCSVGYRSAAMARELQNRGYTNVHNLKGSLFAWVNEGRTVVREGQVVQDVHPYNSEWGKLLDKNIIKKMD